MWTRKELKTKAKGALKRNYWKTVLVALVFTIVCSGVGVFGAANGGGRTEFTYHEPAITEELSDAQVDEMLEKMEEVDDSDIDNPPIDEEQHTFDLARGGEDGEHIVGEVFGNEVDIPLPVLFVGIGVLFVLLIVVIALSLTISAFLTNPVEVGTTRFFTRNLNQAAEINELAFGFDHNYLQTVKTLFWRDLRIVLWGLLFIIPGVVKAYEYRMMPYLLADDPTLSTEEAFAQSKRMMNGNKWRAFVLDLSFFGWYLLAIPTVGLVTIFYANPYKKMTDAALYEALRYGQTAPLENVALPVSTQGATANVSVPVPPFAAVDAPAPTWEDATGTDAPSTDVSADASSAGPVVPDDPQA